MLDLATDLDALKDYAGRIAVFVPTEGKLDPPARRVNRLTKGAVARLIASDGFAKAKTGQVITLAWPAGLAAEALLREGQRRLCRCNACVGGFERCLGRAGFDLYLLGL